MATVEQRPQQPTRQTAAGQRRPQPRRIRVTIRRVNPWSVLKFSLVFYFCLMLIVTIGLAILYMFVDALGVIESIEGFVQQFWDTFRIDSGFLFRTIFLIGLVWVVVWSALTVFVTFLYNLISDLVGGIDVTLTEKR